MNPNSPSVSGQVPDYDAIVVGAGFAGITAARELTRDGYKVIVLEARDRIGGRTWYLDNALDSRPMEMGGTWVHWFQPFTFSELKKHDLELIESPGSVSPTRALLVTNSGRRWVSSEQADLEVGGVIEKFTRGLREQLGRPHELRRSDVHGHEELDEVSILERIELLGLTPDERDIATAYYSVVASAPCSQVSLLSALKWFALSGFDGANQLDTTCRYKIKTGMSSFIEKMATDVDLNVSLSTEVSAVNQEADTAVKVETSDGREFTARAAIVTVPWNVLGRIDFKPGLSSNKQAAYEGHCGMGVKIWARIRGLPDETFYAYAPDDFLINYVQTESIGSDHLVVGFGPNGDLLDASDPDAVADALKALLGEQIEVVESAGHDWRGDPYSNGTWGMLRPTQARTLVPAMQTPQGPVVFAGAETADGWNGFVDGAIESGYRASRQLKELLELQIPVVSS